jgi:hypothetical protein
MAKPALHDLRQYSIHRFTDGAPHLLILDELCREFDVSEAVAAEAMGAARAIIARRFDEADYGFIKACAFAGDSYRQQFYRVRINELRADQQRVREGLTGNMLEDEVSYRIIMAIDRSVQAYATLSHRGRRDLPVAFAPKGVLQDQTPPTDEELDAAIDGAL